MTEVETREWRLIREESRDGPTNMALDEIAAKSATEDGVRTLRVYRWEPSCLSLGYRQSPGSVDWEYCEREGIDVTRRPTGGGGIYHDEYADISYSIVAPADELPGDLMECYDLLCTPVLDAFDRMGVDADFADDEHPAIHEPACYLRDVHPAHDVLASGRKISGNAQYRQREAVIQHGSLSYSLASDRHCGVFDGKPDTDAFEGRVTSVRDEAGIDRDEAVGAVESALADWADADEGGWSVDELAAAADLADSKYRSDAWTKDRTVPS
ncbi:lipoate--protein ligase family protein [Haloarchaeobius sp. HRN-SO-5]|uniref:lipoate--protein ligase family protein n=1 Tax=Haloarchaeobius sp. HRN-SO-5 TaxID=3446118 RepID=UPI003EB9F9A5